MEGVKFTAARVTLGDISNVARKRTEVAVNEKIQNPIVGRRPMTRKFAASLARKSQETIAVREEHKKPICLCASATEVDEYDFPLAMLEEIEEMMVSKQGLNCEHEEVEMVDLEAEPIMDVDECDARNPLVVVDYVEDIYNFFRRTQFPVSLRTGVIQGSSA